MSGFELGEVVVVVDASPPRNQGRYLYAPPIPLKLHAFHKVSGFQQAPNGTIGLLLDGMPPTRLIDGATGWDSARFRKLPRADADFTATIRACRPVKVGEVA